MILDAYLNTLFPQEKQKNQTLFISFPLQFLFFSPNLIYRNMNVNALYGDINFSLHVFFLPRCHR